MRKVSNTQPNPTPKGAGEGTENKAQIQQEKRNHKDRSRNQWNRNQGTVEKFDETGSWFIERTNKIDKVLTRIIKKKRERTQINKIMNEGGEITTTPKKYNC